jgi:hypothetical protein
MLKITINALIQSYRQISPQTFELLGNLLDQIFVLHHPVAIFSPGDLNTALGY